MCCVFIYTYNTAGAKEGLCQQLVVLTGKQVKQLRSLSN